MKRRSPKLAHVIAKYLGRPFEQMGCMPLVAGVYTDLGVPFPRAFEDLTLENYMDRFREDPAGTVVKMELLFSELGQAVDPRRLQVRDLLVVEHPDGVRFPAVYIGNGSAVASFLHGGVTVFGINSHNTVVMARRLLSGEAG